MESTFILHHDAARKIIMLPFGTEKSRQIHINKYIKKSTIFTRLNSKMENDSIEHNWKTASSVHVIHQNNEFISVVFIQGERKISADIPGAQFLFMQAHTYQHITFDPAFNASKAIWPKREKEDTAIECEEIDCETTSTNTVSPLPSYLKK